VLGDVLSDVADDVEVGLCNEYIRNLSLVSKKKKKNQERRPGPPPKINERKPNSPPSPTSLPTLTLLLFFLRALSAFSPLSPKPHLFTLPIRANSPGPGEPSAT
jgi:hypothetical protein